MKYEEAKKLVMDSIKENGVAEVTDDYQEGFNVGAMFTAEIIKHRLRDGLRGVIEILDNPPTVE